MLVDHIVMHENVFNNVQVLFYDVASMFNCDIIKMK
jgi:hypothetical protein